MENKFKQFLQLEFQKIPPTKAGAEYRRQLLHDLLDYARELKLKDIAEEEIIYNLAIKKLGNIDELLQAFEAERLIERTSAKKRSVAMITSISILVPSFLVFLVGSLVVTPPIWSWSWIILLGGIFAALSTLLMLYMINNKSRAKKVFIRASVFIIVSIWVVFASLVLMLIDKNVTNIDKWYTSFIALPAALALADIAVSLATNSKGKWLSVAADIIIFYVILYVILVVLIPGYSHPGWLLILLGIFKAAIELGIVYTVKSRRLQKEWIRT